MKRLVGPPFWHANGQDDTMQAVSPLVVRSPAFRKVPAGQAMHALPEMSSLAAQRVVATVAHRPNPSSWVAVPEDTIDVCMPVAPQGTLHAPTTQGGNLQSTRHTCLLQRRQLVDAQHARRDSIGA